jgi:hypothetical protein
VVALLLALPLAGRAAPAPAVTLTSPTAGLVKAGVLSVTWSYRGFSRAAFVDVEAARGTEPFTRLARVSIDDGTPGAHGSYNWATTPEDDGDDWTIRLIVPSNKWVRSSVSPVVIDNTAPEATEVERSPEANEAGWNNSDVTVTWACTDATSGAAAPTVSATVVGEGTDLSAAALCTDLAGNEATATAGGIDIDRTVPTAAISHVPFGPTGTRAALFDVIGTSADNLSGVAGVTVTFTDASGATTQREAQCFESCGSTEEPWFVSATGLAPGQYTVSAVATDMAGNVGEPSSMDIVVVTAPDVTVPPVTVPDVTVPDVTTVAPAPPAVTVPEVTVPALPPLGLPG